MKQFKFVFVGALLALLAACGQVATEAPEARPELVFIPSSAKQPLAHWDFNRSFTAGSTIPASVGNGSLSLGFTSGIATFTGTTLNATDGGVAGMDLTVRGGANLQNNGRSLVLAVPTLGYRAIELSYATRRSPQGFTEQQVCYSTNGPTFPEDQCKVVTPITNTTTSNLWRVETVNFQAMPGVRNNENFYVRITLLGATDDQGNNRFDNISVLGVPMEEPVVDDPIVDDPVEDDPVGDQPGDGPGDAPGETPGGDTPSDPSVPSPDEPAMDVEIVRERFAANIRGFLPPVDVRRDTFNVIRGGSTVPLKFRVFDGDVEVTDPTRVRLSVVSHGTCNPADQNLLEQEPPLGATGTIQYDVRARQFVANWAVPSRSNQCYAVRAEFWGPGGNYARATSVDALFRTR